ncbi:hypothetical protein BJY01DRAFT_246502 [Aspergillus pseudoustus]|uniref:Uncharacterized protein n=1 Tax=Aspergillus pseudoustus TaxID=1810923 RepID=A0ABR4K832_9EURO
MSLEVVPAADPSSKLRLRINDNEEQTFDLYHYHRDTWTFLPASRDEAIQQGYSAYLYSRQAFLIEFSDRADDDHFQVIRWKLDLDQRGSRNRSLTFGLDRRSLSMANSSFIRERPIASFLSI